MGWTTFLREIVVSLSLIHTYHQHTMCCMSRAALPAGVGDKQKGASPKRAAGKQEGWLLAEVVARGTCCMWEWTVPGLFCSPVMRKELRSGVTRKEKAGQHHHKSRSEMTGLSHLLYLSIYSMVSRSYRCRNRSYLPHNRLFQFLKMGRSLLSKKFNLKMLIGSFH